ncbi:hypothetical protein JWG42_18340 [Desulfoprunum benzoelyticum]|uniref:Putative transcriptional regulator n=1 Tax=Desulfoprunum benzoelyticum TaxID=1506996 RepID=A0A840UTT2_9BACT|nr:hypothetical protein [Desulfoprunum benzoelyticum]MBB5346794.1 putative transcriptional regulator [Desulfoprunum benzoelyticum]MBM9532115.1 hypothetical protein [Desulfoprunum benzoelyticum]
MTAGEKRNDKGGGRRRSEVLESFMHVEGVNEGVSEGVNEGVSRLYQAVKHNPGIRLPELSTRLNVPVKTLERWVKQLRSEKKVVFRGAAKTGGYYVVDGER